MSTGLALSSTGQPPTVTINTSAALAISTRTTAPRVAWTTGLSRFGWVMITPGCAVRSGGVDIAQLTIPPRRRAGHRREAHERPRLLGESLRGASSGAENAARLFRARAWWNW